MWALRVAILAGGGYAAMRYFKIIDLTKEP